jgi:type I restriction enzyme S subunit
MSPQGNEWRETTIVQLGRVVTGTTPPTKRPELYGTKYPFITPTDIQQDFRLVETARFVSEKGRKEFETRLLPPRAVCFVCIGATIGKSCMTTRPSFTNQQINSIVVDENHHDPRFVYYLVRHESEQIKGLAGGAATPIVNKSTFSGVKVCVPPLPTQHKIAAILSAYDDLIENNTRRIAILEQMAQFLYREWFVHFRFPGHEDVEMVDSELGLVPEGWTLKQLGDIAEQVRRNVRPDDVAPGTPYIGLGHMPKDGVIALADWGVADETRSTKLAFKKGEILFGKIRPYFHKVGVAPLEGVCSTDAIVIAPKTEQYFSVVLGCVSSKEFVAHATQTSSGTKMPRANWKVLVEYPIAIPPKHLLSTFDEIIKSTVALTQNLIFRNCALRRTRDLLLPRLISGELDVSELTIDVGEEDDHG